MAPRRGPSCRASGSYAKASKHRARSAASTVQAPVAFLPTGPRTAAARANP